MSPSRWVDGDGPCWLEVGEEIHDERVLTWVVAMTKRGISITD